LISAKQKASDVLTTTRRKTTIEIVGSRNNNFSVVGGSSISDIDTFS
jgi:hypothetical protein